MEGGLEGNGQKAESSMSKESATSAAVLDKNAGFGAKPKERGLSNMSNIKGGLMHKP